MRVSNGVRAYLNRCPHLHYPLNYLLDEFLTYDRRFIQCSMHGASFEKEIYFAESAAGRIKLGSSNSG